MTFPLPLADRPDLVTYVDGEPHISRKGMAYLCGVTEEEVNAEFERQGCPVAFRMPKRWVRQGKENAARVGTDDWAALLTLLAAEREA